MKATPRLALLFALLPLLGLGCLRDPRPAPIPVTKSAAPVAGVARSYGWARPSEKPAASTRYRLKMPQTATALPASVDLRSKDVPIYDQGQLGSCTAHGWAAAVEFRDKNRIVAPAPVSALDRFLIYIHVKPKPVPPKADYFQPSRLFIYYAERSIDGTIGQDAGAAVADGAKVVSTLGTPPESDWPYSIGRFAQRPPAKAYADAKLHVSPEPSSLDTSDLDEVRTALANGHPVVFGFDVYSSFEDVGSDGVYQPRGGNVGGHCVAAVGYDDKNQYVIVRNSWGHELGR